MKPFFCFSGAGRVLLIALSVLLLWPERSLGGGMNFADAERGGASRGERASLSLAVENDLFFGRDEDYTSGCSLGYLSATESPDSLSWWSRTAGRLLGGGAASSAWGDLLGMDGRQEHQWGLSINHLMFTPQSDRECREPLPGERSYAAWLSAGATSLVKTGDRSHTLDVYLGVVGPSALGHQAQDVVHNVVDSPKWKGWDNQMPDEFALQISFERKYRLGFLESTGMGGGRSDGYAFWNADLGNVYIRGGAGLYARYGWNMPARCAYAGWLPNAHYTAPFAGMPDRAGGWSFYFFGGIRGRAVARDIFLDGPMFHHAVVTVEKFPVVGDVFAGACLGRGRWELVFGWLCRTREYHGQRAPQNLGTVLLSYSF